MQEKEGFVKDSKIAFKGVLNGLFGSLIYEIIITLFISFFVTFKVSSQNPGVLSEELDLLLEQEYAAFPYSILISCLSSLAAFLVFVLIIKWDVIKDLFKKALNLKTLKYGVICALCIMGFSIIYNNLAVIIFGLSDGGNANQEVVTNLIKSNVLLGFMSVVVLAPLVEELTYRYCMFGEVSKYKKWLGYLVSGGIFMLMHGVASFNEAGGFNLAFVKELIYLPPYLFSGLALCYVYDKTENVGTSVLAHFLNNFVSFLLVVGL